MPPFRDEHILLIAPGSQTTLAQLGLPESYGQARLRIPTRMFLSDQPGKYEPTKVRERRVKRITHVPDPNYQPPVQASNGMSTEPQASGTDAVNGDAMQTEPTQTETTLANGHSDAAIPEASALPTETPAPPPPPVPQIEVHTEETIVEEDLKSTEGAIYPIQQGRIVDWPCLFALLSHIEKTLGPPLHTPVILIGQPAWTQQDRETLTQFYFEKFKMPAFTIMDAALATTWAFGVASATVVDIGYGKADITAIADFVPNEIGRVISAEGCGGEAMTERLFGLLENKGFTRDMADQLKRSPICEILTRGTPLPSEKTPVATTSGPAGIVKVTENPAAAATTGVTTEPEDANGSAGPTSNLPRGPGPNTQAGTNDEPENKDALENEGVLDIASIVASGKTSDFLAKKDAEKAAKATKKGGDKNATDAAKPVRLPNSQRARATLHYTLPAKPPAEGEEEIVTVINGDGPVPQLTTRKEIEVGTERFRATDGGILDQLADAIHRCILSVPELGRRSDLWNSIIVVGNGSKIRGFKEALLSTLNAKYLISPSTGTFFTSEIPSNFSTPVATGANTPLPQLPPTSHTPGPGVNPLLLAATTASNPNLAPPGNPLYLNPQTPQHQSQSAAQSALGMQPFGVSASASGTVTPGLAQGPGGGSGGSGAHSQTPTSIKMLKLPEYFPEWKDVGSEEAVFLGAQVAAKVIFIQDQGQSKGYMNRTEYNDLGPMGIHEYSM